MATTRIRETVAANREEILRALDALTLPGAEVELRAIGVQQAGEDPHTVSTRFTDLGALADAAMELDHAARGHYVALDPLMPATRATTNDADEAARLWLAIHSVRDSASFTAASSAQSAVAFNPAV